MVFGVFDDCSTFNLTTLFTFGRALRTTASVPLSLPAITRTYRAIHKHLFLLFLPTPNIGTGAQGTKFVLIQIKKVLLAPKIRYASVTFTQFTCNRAKRLGVSCHRGWCYPVSSNLSVSRLDGEHQFVRTVTALLSASPF